MNHAKRWIIGIVLVGLAVTGIAGMARSTVAAALPDDIADLLLEALVGPDGEYAAYAAYQAVLDEYGDVEPYATIAAAELRHIQSLQRQLDKYGIDYPSTNPYLGKIEAPASLEEAAAAWVDGEVANVAMYDELLEQVRSYPDLYRVFSNLRRASLEKHLPAFELAAENGGVSPVSMSTSL